MSKKRKIACIIQNYYNLLRFASNQINFRNSHSCFMKKLALLRAAISFIFYYICTVTEVLMCSNYKLFSLLSENKEKHLFISVINYTIHLEISYYRS